MNEPNAFQYICRVQDLKEGKGHRFYVDGCDVAVFKVNDIITALNNICPHQKSAIIYDGIIDGGKVTCPAHGWEFNLKTGCYSDGRKGLDVYEIKIENEKVFVKVIQKEFNW